MYPRMKNGIIRSLRYPLMSMKALLDVPPKPYSKTLQSKSLARFLPAALLRRLVAFADKWFGIRASG